MNFNNGYLEIYMPQHPNARANGVILEHRYVAGQKLGRPLKPEEVVHHLDENRLNNDPDNLIVFKTQADHSAFHQGCETVLDGDVYWCPNKHCYKLNGHSVKILCPICNENYMLVDSNMCVKCARALQRKVDRPSKEELLELIKTTPFVKIGAVYGVSDNAIRKWCKQYDLPYKQKDIKQLLN